MKVFIEKPYQEKISIGELLIMNPRYILYCVKKGAGDSSSTIFATLMQKEDCLYGFQYIGNIRMDFKYLSVTIEQSIIKAVEAGREVHAFNTEKQMIDFMYHYINKDGNN